MKQPEDLSLVEMLRQGKAETDHSFELLWWRYRTRGVAAGLPESDLVGLSAFKSYFRGSTTPDVDHYELIAGVLNEELTNLGKELRLPTLGFRIAPMGDGAFETDPQTETMWFTLGPSEQDFQAANLRIAS